MAYHGCHELCARLPKRAVRAGVPAIWFYRIPVSFTSKSQYQEQAIVVGPGPKFTDPPLPLPLPHLPHPF